MKRKKIQIGKKLKNKKKKKKKKKAVQCYSKQSKCSSRFPDCLKRRQAGAQQTTRLKKYITPGNQDSARLILEVVGDIEDGGGLRGFQEKQVVRLLTQTPTHSSRLPLIPCTCSRLTSLRVAVYGP